MGISCQWTSLPRTTFVFAIDVIMRGLKMVNTTKKKKKRHLAWKKSVACFYLYLFFLYISMSHCHDEHCEHDHDDLPESGEQALLYSKIDIDNVRCLNEAEPNSGKVVIRPWNERLDNTKVFSFFLVYNPHHNSNSFL
jgi:hypothetical protein